MNTNVNIFVPSLAGGGAEKAAVLYCEYLKARYPNRTCRLFLLEGVDVYSNSADVGHVEVLPNGIIERIAFLRAKLDDKDLNLIYLSTVKFFILLFFARRSKNVYAFLQNPLKEALALKKQNFFIQKIRFLFIRFIYIYGIKKVFAIAPGIEEELNAFGVLNTSLIPNPIREIPNGMQRCARSSHKVLNILSAGRLHPQKNYMRLIEAARHIESDFVIHIFGEGQQEHELKELIRLEELGDRIFLRGFVDDLSPEFAWADLFLLTSDYEGFGNVIIEALAHGTKVISTNVPHGPSYILNDESIGILTDKDPIQIAAAINWAQSSGWLHDRPQKCVMRARDFLIESVGKKITVELMDENHS